ncbi:MAG: sensor domain-containing protein, partial [Mycobacterium sp.]
AMLVGDWSAEGQSLHTRAGGCGRDYRVKSVALLEVTFCRFPDSVSDIVITNLADRVPA